MLLLLGLIGCWIGWIFANRYAEPYRERAAGYDLDLIGEVEVPSIILGRDGGEVGRIFVQNRSVIGMDKVPQNFVDALRAAEDKRFYEHGGVDLVGITRAAKDWMMAGEAVSGASTITQQLARGAFPLEADRQKYDETDLERKMVEAFLALRIEERYPKEQILEFYLNRIYFGSGYYGLRSASLGYFGKEPADLTLLESATIVGLIKNPTGLSPLNNKAASRRARDMVIDRLQNNGVVEAVEASRMRARPIELDPKPLRRGTTHVYERIADELRELLGEEGMVEGGLKIRTSIDSRVQRAAERELEEALRRAENHSDYKHPPKDRAESPKDYLQGAVYMVDHRNGAVIAHVGGRDYAEVPYDMIELGRRPLGTAFHPFLYAAALEVGKTPATLVDDEPMDNRAVMVGGREGILGEWGMETPNPRYEGAITLRRALESSKVAAAVRVANDIGLENVVETANRFGLPMDDVELLPRLAVGWEAASLKDAVRAYSAFPRGGEPNAHEPWYVASVRDASGRLRYERAPSAADGEAAVSEATAYQIHSILRGGMRGGSADGVLDGLDEVPFNGAAKPGTTHDFSDNWFLGYNGRLSCGVWIGFLGDGKTIYDGAFARDLAMPVWKSAMNAASDDFGGRGIPRPADVVETEICRVSGELVTPYCYEMVEDESSGRMRSQPSAMTEYFRRGTEKRAFCSIHSGAASEAPDQGAYDLGALAVIDASPVVPLEENLIGDDPYHSVHANSEGVSRSRGRGTRTNVLDSFDLEDSVDSIRLPLPDRLEIEPE